MEVSVYLDGGDLREAGQVLGVGNGGDELDGAHDGAGGPPVPVGAGHAGHAGAGGAGGVGVVKGGHGEGAGVARVRMLHVA